jgi:hypothetical protein
VSDIESEIILKGDKWLWKAVKDDTEATGFPVDTIPQPIDFFMKVSALQGVAGPAPFPLTPPFALSQDQDTFGENMLNSGAEVNKFGGKDAAKDKPNANQLRRQQEHQMKRTLMVSAVPSNSPVTFTPR